MTIRADRARSRFPSSRIDRGVPGVFHRGSNRRRSKQRRTTWPVRERRLGTRLDRDLAGWAVALHSRLPAADLDCQPIDHLVVTPAGVWVVGADHDLLRVDSISCAHTVSARRNELERQGDAARTVLSAIGFDWLDIDLVICATNARNARRRPMRADGIWCARPGAMLSLMTRSGPLAHPDVIEIVTELADRFPAAQ